MEQWNNGEGRLRGQGEVVTGGDILGGFAEIVAVAIEGVAKHLREAVEAAGPVAPAPVQAALDLGEDDDAGPFGGELIEAAEWTERKRGGRPRGSRNRRSEELVGWLLKGYRHPLHEAMDAISAGPVELAQRWQIKRSEAAAIWRQLVGEVLPYFESRKPVALQVDTRAIQLILHRHEGGAGADLPPWLDGAEDTMPGTAAQDGSESS
jgi:hypothetical protein